MEKMLNIKMFQQVYDCNLRAVNTFKLGIPALAAFFHPQTKFPCRVKSAIDRHVFPTCDMSCRMSADDGYRAVRQPVTVTGVISQRTVSPGPRRPRQRPHQPSIEQLTPAPGGLRHRNTTSGVVQYGGLIGGTLAGDGVFPGV